MDANTVSPETAPPDPNAVSSDTASPDANTVSSDTASPDANAVSSDTASPDANAVSSDIASQPPMAYRPSEPASDSTQSSRTRFTRFARLTGRGERDDGPGSPDRERATRGWVRARHKASNNGASSSPGSVDPAVLAELETEVTLLREENAQLKVDRHRPLDPGTVVETMRALRGADVGDDNGYPKTDDQARAKPSESEPDESESDDASQWFADSVAALSDEGNEAVLEDAWQVITECLVMRNGLREACREVETTMSRMQTQLSALTLELERRGLTEHCRVVAEIDASLMAEAEAA
jgi:hypothetical protein